MHPLDPANYSRLYDLSINPGQPLDASGPRSQSRHPQTLSLAGMSKNTLAALYQTSRSREGMAMLAIHSNADSILSLQSAYGRNTSYATADGDLSVHARWDGQPHYDILSIASPYANPVYLSVRPPVITHPTASPSAFVAASSSPAQWILRSSAPAANPCQSRRTRKPGATNQQIQEELRDSNNTLRSESQIAEALSSRGLGVRRTRLTEALQNVRGPKFRPSASDAQIIEELRRAGGRRAAAKAVRALNLAGLGVQAARARRLQQQLQEQVGATGAQPVD